MLGILSLTVGSIAGRKVISHHRRSCGVRYHRLRAERKRNFAHHLRSCDAIRVSPIAELARKRETTLAERFSWLSRVKIT